MYTPQDNYIVFWISYAASIVVGGVSFIWLLGWAITFGATETRSFGKAVLLLLAWPFFLGDALRRLEK